MKAYHIVEWKRLYELTAKGSPYNLDKPDEDLRKTPIPYIRYSDNGLLLSPSYRRLAKHGNKLGVLMGMAAYGLYWKLVDIAKAKRLGFRGWILDENNYPLDAEHVADILEINDREWVEKLFGLLVYLGKLELKEVPTHFPVPADSRNSRSQREFLEPFKNETETEVNKNISLNERDFQMISEKPLVSEKPLAGHDSPQPVEAPCPAPPSVKDSVKDSVRDSGDTDTASASVSVTAPKGGQGREKEMAKARQLFLLELTDIIHWRNQSDRTTLVDISDALEHRVTYETEDDLFAEALEKARGCAEVARNPLAMFVSAMKKSPFHYIPKGTSYIRGAKDKYHV